MSSPGSREITRCPRHTHSSQGGGIMAAALHVQDYMNRKSKRYPRANCNPCMNLTVIEFF